MIIMNVQPKILLTIQLEGVLGPRSERKEIIPYNVDTFEGKRISGIAHHYNREEKMCVRKTLISEYAYDYFVSDEIPSWYTPKNPEAMWTKLPKSIRLQLHLQRIAEYRDFSYEIL